jgi:hypothetical protein
MAATVPGHAVRVMRGWPSGRGRSLGAGERPVPVVSGVTAAPPDYAVLADQGVVSPARTGGPW